MLAELTAFVCGLGLGQSQCLGASVFKQIINLDTASRTRVLEDLQGGAENRLAMQCAMAYRTVSEKKWGRKKSEITNKGI